MDNIVYSENIKSVIIFLQMKIEAGALVPDQVESALQIIQELRRLRRAHSDERMRNIVAKLAVLFLTATAYSQETVAH